MIARARGRSGTSSRAPTRRRVPPGGGIGRVRHVALDDDRRRALVLDEVQNAREVRARVGVADEPDLEIRIGRDVAAFRRCRRCHRIQTCRFHRYHPHCHPCRQRRRYPEYRPSHYWCPPSRRLRRRPWRRPPFHPWPLHRRLRPLLRRDRRSHPRSLRSSSCPTKASPSRRQRMPEASCQRRAWLAFLPAVISRDPTYRDEPDRARDSGRQTRKLWWIRNGAKYSRFFAKRLRLWRNRRVTFSRRSSGGEETPCGAAREDRCLALALAGFNLGVELGQLLALGVVS